MSNGPETIGDITVSGWFAKTENVTYTPDAATLTGNLYYFNTGTTPATEIISWTALQPNKVFIFAVGGGGGGRIGVNFSTPGANGANYIISDLYDIYDNASSAKISVGARGIDANGDFTSITFGTTIIDISGGRGGFEAGIEQNASEPSMAGGLGGPSTSPGGSGGPGTSFTIGGRTIYFSGGGGGAGYSADGAGGGAGGGDASGNGGGAGGGINGNGIAGSLDSSGNNDGALGGGGGNEGNGGGGGGGGFGGGGGGGGSGGGGSGGAGADGAVFLFVVTPALPPDKSSVATLITATQDSLIISGNLSITSGSPFTNATFNLYSDASGTTLIDTVSDASGNGVDTDASGNYEATFSGLTIDTPYWVSWYLSNAEGNGDPSDLAPFSTLGNYPGKPAEPILVSKGTTLTAESITVLGKPVDSSGEPVSGGPFNGIFFKLYDASGSTQIGDTFESTTSDSSGNFIAEFGLPDYSLEYATQYNISWYLSNSTGGSGSESDFLTVTTLIAPPAFATSNNSSSTSITFVGNTGNTAGAPFTKATFQLYSDSQGDNIIGDPLEVNEVKGENANYQATFTGLTPNTTYYCRWSLSNADTYGEFSSTSDPGNTMCPAPTLVSVTSSTAIISGNPTGSISTVDEATFRLYTINEVLIGSEVIISATDVEGNYVINLIEDSTDWAEELYSNTSYKITWLTRNAEGYGNQSDFLTFTILVEAPGVPTLVTSTSSTLTLSGSTSGVDGPNPFTDATFTMYTDASGTSVLKTLSDASGTDLSGNGVELDTSGNYIATFSELDASTPYWARWYLSNAGGAGDPSDLAPFTTDGSGSNAPGKPGPPTAVAGFNDIILTGNSSDVSGNITGANFYLYDASGIVMDASGNGGQDLSNNFFYTFTGLPPSTAYQGKWSGLNGAEEGDQSEATLISTLAEPSAPTVSNATSTSITVVGDSTNTNGLTINGASFNLLDASGNPTGNGIEYFSENPALNLIYESNNGLEIDYILPQGNRVYDILDTPDASGNYTAVFRNLIPGKTYKVSWALNTTELGVGPESAPSAPITTLATPPVTIPFADNIYPGVVFTDASGAHTGTLYEMNGSEPIYSMTIDGSGNLEPNKVRIWAVGAGGGSNSLPGGGGGIIAQYDFGLAQGAGIYEIKIGDEGNTDIQDSSGVYISAGLGGSGGGNGGDASAAVLLSIGGSGGAGHSGNGIAPGVGGGAIGGSDASNNYMNVYGNYPGNYGGGAGGGSGVQFTTLTLPIGSDLADSSGYSLYFGQGGSSMNGVSTFGGGGSAGGPGFNGLVLVWVADSTSVSNAPGKPAEPILVSKGFKSITVSGYPVDSSGEPVSGAPFDKANFKLYDASGVLESIDIESSEQDASGNYTTIFDDLQFVTQYNITWLLSNPAGGPGLESVPLSVITLIGPPGAPTLVSANTTSITVSGNPVDILGDPLSGAPFTSATFRLFNESNEPVGEPVVVLDEDGSGNYIATFNNLTSGIGYNCAFSLSNIDTDGLPSALSLALYTSPGKPGPPTAQATFTTISLTGNSSDVSGNITDANFYLYDASENPLDNYPPNAQDNSGNFFVTITGLPPSTAYQAKWSLINNGAEGLQSEATLISTLAEPPAPSAPTVSNATSTSITVVGDSTTTSGGPFGEVFFYLLDASGNPTGNGIEYFSGNNINTDEYLVINDIIYNNTYESNNNLVSEYDTIDFSGNRTYAISGTSVLPDASGNYTAVFQNLIPGKTYRVSWSLYHEYDAFLGAVSAPSDPITTLTTPPVTIPFADNIYPGVVFTDASGAHTGTLYEMNGTRATYSMTIDGSGNLEPNKVRVWAVGAGGGSILSYMGGGGGIIAQYDFGLGKGAGTYQIYIGNGDNTYIQDSSGIYISAGIGGQDDTSGGDASDALLLFIGGCGGSGDGAGTAPGVGGGPIGGSDASNNYMNVYGNYPGDASGNYGGGAGGAAAGVQFTSLTLPLGSDLVDSSGNSLYFGQGGLSSDEVITFGAGAAPGESGFNGLMLIWVADSTSVSNAPGKPGPPTAQARIYTITVTGNPSGVSGNITGANFYLYDASGIGMDTFGTGEQDASGNYSIIFTGLPSSTAYQAKWSLLNGAEEGDQSNATLISTLAAPPAPPTPTVSNATKTTITVVGNSTTTTGGPFEKASFYLLDASGNPTGNGNKIFQGAGNGLVYESNDGLEFDGLNIDGNRVYNINDTPDASGNYTAVFRNLIPGKTYKVSWALNTNEFSIGAASAPSAPITTLATPPVTIPFADNIYPGVAFTDASGTYTGTLYEMNGSQSSYSMTIDGSGNLEPNKVRVWAVGAGGGGNSLPGGGGGIIAQYDFGLAQGAGTYDIIVGGGGENTYIQYLTSRYISAGGGGNGGGPGEYVPALLLSIGGSGGAGNGVGGGAIGGSDASDNYFNVFGNYPGDASGNGGGAGVQFTTLTLPIGSDLADSSGNSLYFGQGGSSTGEINTFGGGVPPNAGPGINGLVLIWVADASVPQTSPGKPTSGPIVSNITGGGFRLTGNPSGATGVTGSTTATFKIYDSSGSFLSDNAGTSDASGNYYVVISDLEPDTVYQVSWFLSNGAEDGPESDKTNPNPETLGAPGTPNRPTFVSYTGVSVTVSGNSTGVSGGPFTSATFISDYVSISEYETTNVDSSGIYTYTFIDQSAATYFNVSWYLSNGASGNPSEEIEVGIYYPGKPSAPICQATSNTIRVLANPTTILNYPEFRSGYPFNDAIFNLYEDDSAPISIDNVSTTLDSSGNYIYTFENLTPGYTYKVGVTLRNIVPGSAVLESDYTTVITLPDQPAAPTLVQATATTIELSGNPDVSGNATSARFYLYDASGIVMDASGVDSNLDASGNYSIVFTGLPSSTAYQAKWSLINSGGESLKSNATPIATLAAVQNPPGQPGPPIAEATSTTITLTGYPDVSGNVTSANLFLYDASGTIMDASGNDASQDASGNYSIVFTGLPSSTTYQAKWSLLNGASEGLQSEATSVTTLAASLTRPGKPSAPPSTKSSFKGILLIGNANDVSGNVTSANFYLYDASGIIMDTSGNSSDQDSSGNFTLRIRPLPPDTTYQAKWSALNDTEEGEQSDATLVSTLAAPPAPNVSNPTKTTITVTGDSTTRNGQPFIGAAFYLLDSSGNPTGNGREFDASSNNFVEGYYVIDINGNNLDLLDSSGNRFFLILDSPDASGNYTATFQNLIPTKTYKVSWSLDNGIGEILGTLTQQSAPSDPITTLATPPVTIPFADNIYPGVVFTDASGAHTGTLYEMNGTQTEYSMTIDGSGNLEPNKVRIWAVGGGGGGDIDIYSSRGGGGGSIIANYDFGYYVGAGVYNINVAKFVTGGYGDGILVDSIADEENITTIHHAFQGDNTFIFDSSGNIIAVGGGGAGGASNASDTNGKTVSASHLYIGGNASAIGNAVGGGPIGGLDASSNYMNVFGNNIYTTPGSGAAGAGGTNDVNTGGAGVQFSHLTLPEGSDLVDSSGNSLYFGKGSSVLGGDASTFGGGGGSTLTNYAGHGFNGLMLIWVADSTSGSNAPGKPSVPTVSNISSSGFLLTGDPSGVDGVTGETTARFHLYNSSGDSLYTTAASFDSLTGAYYATIVGLSPETTYQATWFLSNGSDDGEESEKSFPETFPEGLHVSIRNRGGDNMEISPYLNVIYTDASSVSHTGRLYQLNLPTNYSFQVAELTGPNQVIIWAVGSGGGGGAAGTDGNLPGFPGGGGGAGGIIANYDFFNIGSGIYGIDVSARGAFVVSSTGESGSFTRLVNNDGTTVYIIAGGGGGGGQGGSDGGSGIAGSAGETETGVNISIGGNGGGGGGGAGAGTPGAGGGVASGSDVNITITFGNNPGSGTSGGGADSSGNPSMGVQFSFTMSNPSDPSGCDLIDTSGNSLYFGVGGIGDTSSNQVTTYGSGGNAGSDGRSGLFLVWVTNSTASVPGPPSEPELSSKGARSLIIRGIPGTTTGSPFLSATFQLYTENGDTEGPPINVLDVDGSGNYIATFENLNYAVTYKVGWFLTNDIGPGAESALFTVTTLIAAQGAPEYISVASTTLNVSGIPSLLDGAPFSSATFRLRNSLDEPIGEVVVLTANVDASGNYPARFTDLMPLNDYSVVWFLSNENTDGLLSEPGIFTTIYAGPTIVNVTSTSVTVSGNPTGGSNDTLVSGTFQLYLDDGVTAEGGPVVVSTLDESGNYITTFESLTPETPYKVSWVLTDEYSALGESDLISFTTLEALLAPSAPSAPVLSNATKTTITVTGNSTTATGEPFTGAVFYLLDASGNPTGNGREFDASSNNFLGPEYNIIDTSGNGLDVIDPSGNRIYGFFGDTPPDASGNYTVMFQNLIPSKTYRVSWALANIVDEGPASVPSAPITTLSTPPVRIPFADNIYPGVVFTDASGAHTGTLYEMNGTQNDYPMTIDGSGNLEPNKVRIWAVGHGGSSIGTLGGGGGGIIAQYDFGLAQGAGTYEITIGNGDNTVISGLNTYISAGLGGQGGGNGYSETSALLLFIGGCGGGGDDSTLPGSGGGPIGGSDASDNYMNVYGNYPGDASGNGGGAGGDSSGVQFTTLTLPVGSDLADSSGNSLYFGQGGSSTGQINTFGGGGSAGGPGFNGLVLVWVADAALVPVKPSPSTLSKINNGTLNRSLVIVGDATNIENGPFLSATFQLYNSTGSQLLDSIVVQNPAENAQGFRMFSLMSQTITFTATFTNLSPSTTYQVAWAVSNAGGLGEFSNKVSFTTTAICFLRGSKILCLNEGLKEEYMAIETIKVGTPVKILNGSYVKVHTISKKTFNNPDNADRGPNRLFKLTPKNYPELTEDLIITGCHSILVDKLEPKQKARHLQLMKSLYMTTGKFRLMAFIDENAEPYLSPGDHEIWHFALENEEITCNYGVYANGGLLVETASIKNMTERVGLVRIE